MEIIQAGRKTYYVDDMFRVGIYVLSEDDDYQEVCLIESGVDASYAKLVDDLLEAKHFRVSLIINTHYHADHSGGNAYFQRKYGCRIVSTGLNVSLMTHYEMCPAIIWGCNPVNEVLNNYFLAEDSVGCDISTYELPQGISYFDLSGHASSMIGVRTDDDVVFLGDAVVGQETLDKHRLIYLYDVDKSLESLRRLRNIKASLYVPYHTDAVEDIDYLVDINEKVILDNIETVRNVCRTPKPMDEIISDVFNIYGYKLTMYKYAVEGGVVKTYVTYLYNKGILTAANENNYMKFVQKAPQ